MDILDLHNKVKGKPIESCSIHLRPQSVTRCSCGQSYTVCEFSKLPFVGNCLPADGNEPSRLEQRNCICKSTIGVWYNTDGSINLDEV